MNDVKRMRVSDALKAIETSNDGLYGVLLARGTLEIGFYRPGETDLQQPHDQDEIYFIQSGEGFFECAGVSRPFEAGEALFVAAGVDHRFLDYSDDFTAWVVFYGPPGGEAEDEPPSA